jgi:medium-chain acyl-[acyl-carrier-protein] hydrolase
MPSANANCWLPNRAEATDTTFRVFCFPHAGGGASAYRGWTRDQPPGVEICAVQLPGREGRIRESFPEEIVALAGTLADVLLPHLDVPYALVGNSVGALVAFELARHLQQWYCLPPIRLVAAACRPPGTGSDLPPVSGLTDTELATAVQNRYGGIPREIMLEPSHLAAFLPALRGDLAMSEAYRPPPGPPLDCPVTAVVGADDVSISGPELAGWNACTAGAFDRVELPGDHFALLWHRDEVLVPLCAEAALVHPAGPRPATAPGGQPGS